MAQLFAPLSTSFLGFDPFFADIQRMLDLSASQLKTNGFPPLNLYQEENGDYTIQLAVAGFKKADIKIEHDRDRQLLTITGDNSPKATDGFSSILDKHTKVGDDGTRSIDLSAAMAEAAGPEVAPSEAPAKSSLTAVEPKRTVVQQGIATRRFMKQFTLAKDFEVQNASLEDGMLTISISHVPRKASKPIQIALA